MSEFDNYDDDKDLDKEIDYLQNQMLNFLIDLKDMCILSSFFIETKDSCDKKNITNWLKDTPDDTLHEIILLLKHIEQHAANVTLEDIENRKELKDTDLQSIYNLNQVIHEENLTKDNVIDIADKKILGNLSEDLAEELKSSVRDLDIKELGKDKMFTEHQLDVTSKFLDSYNFIDMILAWEMGSKFNTWEEFIKLPKAISTSENLDLHYLYLQNLVILAKEELFNRTKGKEEKLKIYNHGLQKHNFKTLKGVKEIMEISQVEKNYSLSMTHNFPCFIDFLDNHEKLGYKIYEGISKVDGKFLYSPQVSFFQMNSDDTELLILSIDFDKNVDEQYNVSIFNKENEEREFSLTSSYLKQIIDWSNKYLDIDYTMNISDIMNRIMYLKNILF